MSRAVSAIAKTLRAARSEIRKKQRAVARYDSKVISAGLTRREFKRKKAGKKVYQGDKHGYTGGSGERTEGPASPTNDCIETP